MAQLETAGALIDFDDSGAPRMEWDLNPDSFLDSDGAQFAEIGVPGMSHPRIQYSAGGARTLSFALPLHYGALRGNRTVAQSVDLLRSWLYPDYKNGIMTKAPHRLLVCFGDRWSDEKWVLTQFDVEYLRFDKDGKPLHAMASLTLTEYIEKSRSREEIKR